MLATHGIRELTSHSLGSVRKLFSFCQSTVSHCYCYLSLHFIFSYVMCVCVGGVSCAQVSVSVQGGQERLSGPRELELQVLVCSQHGW